MYVCVYIYICIISDIYIYIERERERERDRAEVARQGSTRWAERAVPEKKWAMLIVIVI